MASKGSNNGLQANKDVEAVAAARDWKELGDELESYLLTESEKLSLAKAQLHTKQKLTASEAASIEWSYSYTEDNIAVFRKKSDDCSFVGQGVIDVPLNQVAELVKDIESSYVWEKYLVEARCVRVLSASESHIDYIGYERFETSSCLYTFRRDMLYFNRCVYRSGKYIQSQVSVEDAEYPLRDRVPRIDVKKGTGFILEPFEGDDTKTLAAFYCCMDLQGLPKFINTRVVRTYPLVIQDIRKYMAERDRGEGLLDDQSHSHSQAQAQPARGRACTAGVPRVTETAVMRETPRWRSGVFSMQYEEPMPLDHYIR